MTMRLYVRVYVGPERELQTAQIMIGNRRDCSRGFMACRPNVALERRFYREGESPQR